MVTCGPSCGDCVVAPRLNIDVVRWVHVDEVNRVFVHKVRNSFTITCVATQQAVPTQVDQVTCAGRGLVRRLWCHVRVRQPVRGGGLEAADQIVSLYTDPAELDRMSRVGRDLVRDRFSSEAVLKVIAEDFLL